MNCRGCRRVVTGPCTITTPASAVWPWIAQMRFGATWGASPTTGSRTARTRYAQRRPGARRLSGSQVGDTLGTAEPHRSSGSNPSTCSPIRSGIGTPVWSFVLREHDGKTRLISRNRFRLPSLAAGSGCFPWSRASLVMERKMLRWNQAAGRALAGSADGDGRRARCERSSTSLIAAPRPPDEDLDPVHRVPCGDPDRRPFFDCDRRGRS